MTFELHSKRSPGAASISTPFLTVHNRGMFVSAAVRRQLDYSRVNIMVDEENHLIRLAPTDARSGYSISRGGTLGIHHLDMPLGRYLPNGDELTFRPESYEA